MGIEALSRGAAESWFVEEDRANVRAIRQNLETCGFQGWGSVLRDRLPGCLSRLESQGRFEIVFVDPPYEGEVGAAVLAELGFGKLLAPAAWVVMEHRKTESLPLRHGSLQHRRTARYGDSALSFYRIP
jgi:16S rRNA (guanine966-N2)-methyltransferase